MDKSEQYLKYKKYCEENKEKQYKRKREFFLNNKNRLNELRRIRETKQRRNDIRYNLDKRIGRAIWYSLRKNKNGYHWEDLVGYTVEELKQHLENQFKEGMNWDKFLKGEIHIDHIIPKSLFKYNDSEDREFKQCWALANLQPLWAEDNIKKSNEVLT